MTQFNASSVRQQTIYYNAGGQAVATITYTNGGDPVITLDEYEDAAPERPDAIVVKAESADAPAAAAALSAEPVSDGRRYDDWLLFGAATLDLPAPVVGGAFGPAPSRQDLAEALFLAGIALPLAAKGAAAVKLKRKATLSIFDPSTDRFERIDEGEEAWDLPFAAHGDPSDGECDFL